MFNAVYILAHAQEHFFEEGITLKHVCDWAMVLKTYVDTVDWEEWKLICKNNGMLAFGYAMSRLATKLCSIGMPSECLRDDEADRRLLNDILYRADYEKGGRSDWQVRMDLVKGILKNSWKYRIFSDTTSGHLQKRVD